MANGVDAVKSQVSEELERWAKYQREFWRDPIHLEEGMWYFWDETWANRHGPFQTREEAENHLSCYGMWLEDGTPVEDLTVGQRWLYGLLLVLLYAASSAAVVFLLYRGYKFLFL